MQFDKHALILAVVEGLNQQESWTGKTHVQKALFLMDAAGLLKAPFHFVLYKHGPFMTDFEAELEQMKSYAALKSDTVEGWYGVRLSPGMNAALVKRMSPVPEATLKAVGFVCQFVGRRGVVELEPLATAVWIRTREGIVQSDKVAMRLHELKPHVPLHDAENADREALKLLESARRAVQTRQP
jgi:hypothetical protein